MLRIIQRFTIFYVIILTLLLESPSGVREVVPTAGGYTHLVIFTLLGFLVELSREKKSMLFWIIVLILYSVVTEVLQGLLSPICYRCFDWEDICQNVLGVLFGTFAGYYCRRYRG